MAVAVDPPDLKAGDPVSAAWLNSLKAMAKRCRTITAPGCDLSSRQTDEGNVISLSLPPGAYHAKVTQQIGLATQLSNGSLKLGKGKATLYFESYNANNDGVLAPMVGDQWVYFAAPSGGQTVAIPVGQWIMVARTASGRYAVCTGYC